MGSCGRLWVCEMGFLKNRKIAVLIAFVIAVLATLFGVHRSLSFLSGDIERMFYDGVYLDDEGYTQPGIDSQVSRYAAATLDIASVLVLYPVLSDSAEEVMQLRRVLLDAQSIGDKSLAFWTMSRYVNSLIQAAAGVDLSERDMEVVSVHSRTISGAEGFIREAAYNQRVSERWSEQSALARLIGAFTPVREPEMF